MLIMKFEKQLNDFCVTYMHNPLECPKCLEVCYCDDDDFEETFYKEFVAKEINLKQDLGSKNVPSNSVPKTRRVSRDVSTSTQFPLPRTQLSSSRCTKKNTFYDIKPSSSAHSASFKKISKTKSLSKPLKSTCPSNKAYTERNEIVKKKQSSKSVQKTTGDKIPGKGTLKRRRWFLEQLQQRNENYEDDLFEDQKFGHFRNLLEDNDSDTEKNYTGLKTPIFPFSLSPRESTPSPEYTDCYCAEQLSLSRKRSAEYLYRLKKKRKILFPATKQEPETPKVVQETKPEAILDRLMQVEKILKTHINQEKSDTEEDPYFSDILK